VVDVAARVARATNGADATLVIGALLHYVVEDCGVTVETLAARFGPDVAALVAEVSVWWPGAVVSMPVWNRSSIQRYRPQATR